MMKNKSTFNSTVALIRYRPDADSSAGALDLCQGLQGISSKTQILIQPNLVFWDDSLPSWRVEGGKPLVERYKTNPQFDQKIF
jgi:hypothetical protein